LKREREVKDAEVMHVFLLEIWSERRVLKSEWIETSVNSEGDHELISYEAGIKTGHGKPPASSR